MLHQTVFSLVAFLVLVPKHVALKAYG